MILTWVTVGRSGEGKFPITGSSSNENLERAGDTGTSEGRGEGVFILGGMDGGV